MERIKSIAKFLQSQYKLSEKISFRLACVQEMVKNSDFILKTSIYKRDDYLRIYFDTWSQNRFSAIENLHSIYYCAYQDDFFYKTFAFGVSKIKKICDENLIKFSGARTRIRYEEFRELCLCLKNK